MNGLRFAPLFLLRFLNTASRRSVEKFESSYAELPDCYLPAVQDDRKALQLFARIVRHGAVPSRQLFDRLAGLKPTGPQGMAPLDWFEWCLFLFTEKDWGALVTCVACVDVKGLPRGPHRSGIFDLAWLCKYRLLLRGKTKLAAQVERWLIENRAEIPKEQAAVFEAFDRFLAADPNGDPNEIIAAAKGYTPYFALSAVRTLYPAETPFAHANVIPHEWIRSSDKPVVVSVAMDAAYFELYFQPFVDRLQHTAPDIGLHLCAVDFILNPDLLPAKVGLSRMRVPRSVRGTKPARRAFFASARYLSLSDCLKHYEQIHVTDIDGIITPEIHNQLSAPVTLHSKLLTARAARLPFERVSAAGVSVRNDADGHRFASYMRSYLQHGFESSREGQWYIDQNALFSAWHSLKDSITFETDRPAFFKQAANWNLAGGAQAKIDFQTGSAL